MNEVIIKIDDLVDGRVIELLESHHKEMHLYSPAESIHALDKSKFSDDSLAFWSARYGDTLAACGALLEIDSNQGEIKSMRTSKQYLRQGLAEKILLVILSECEHRNYHRVSLETGTHQAFLPAISLYQKHGFTECAPFAEYESDPFSLFMTRVI